MYTGTPVASPVFADKERTAPSINIVYKWSFQVAESWNKPKYKSISALRVRSIVCLKTFHNLKALYPQVPLGLVLQNSPSHLSFSCFVLRSKHKRTKALAMDERFLESGQHPLTNSEIEDCHQCNKPQIQTAVTCMKLDLYYLLLITEHHRACQ